MKKYRALVIGCGHIGIEDNCLIQNLRPTSHAKGYLQHPRTELVALVDKDIQKINRAKKLFPKIATFLDAQEAIKKTYPEIVSVATPTQTHFEVVKNISKYNCINAIVCEKPIAMDIGDAREMIRVCKNRRIKLSVNHSRRFDSNLRKIFFEIKKYGPITKGASYYTRGIYNNGTHLIDLLNFYIGPVEEVQGFRSEETEDWSDLVNDLNIDGTLFFKLGAKITIQSLRSDNFSIFEINLFGKNGLIKINNLGYQAELFRIEKSDKFIDKKELKKKPKIIKVKNSMVLSMISNVIDNLEGNSYAFGDGEEALKNLKVIDALRKSAYSGGKTFRIEK